ncbi:DUF6230 family protein [Nocardioides jejuensis]|uniref:Cholesterol esterase n=1 Tax=Nocardioides jejuensis TaxID=2502782 RepID=A0A4R1BVA5_9ACTN|nr:DUF6230 family protein [Nocardioides jejuensis]TCJ21910.1 hypothetical protein EPD65_14080 [Nocardioides jejuensis]
MRARAADAAAYGTRWRQTAPLLLLAFLMMAAALTLLRQNVLAAVVTYQGSTAKFSSGRVTGQDVGFGMAQVNVAGAGTKTVLAAGFATGTLDGLCVSQVQTLPVIGDVVIKLTSGDGNSSTREIEATNVQLDITQLRGSGTGINLDGRVQIGMASQDITTLAGVDNPLSAPTGTGWWGIDATAGDIFSAKGYLYDAEIGGPMTLPGLRISVTPKSAGGTECWSTPGDATPLPH